MTAGARHGRADNAADEGETVQVRSDSPQLRLGIVAIVVVSLFATLLVRMWSLQVIESERYTVASEANRVRVIADEAPRGRILDVNGRVIVDNRISRIVTIDRSELDTLDDAARDDLLSRLAAELTGFGVPSKVDRLEGRLVDPQYDPVQPIPVAIDVPQSFEIFLSERSAEFPGVEVRRTSVRNYPNGAAAAHLVGYVGRISAEEYGTASSAVRLASDGGDPGLPLVLAAAVDKPYKADSSIGKTGIERAYERELRGVPGQRRIEVDSSGRSVRTVSVVPAVPGNDLQLTIDLELQLQAEAQLAAQLESLRGTRIRAGAVTRAPAGAVVLSDPRDGALRALASYPTYEPADFVNGISSERYEALTGGSSTENPLTNRAVSGQYAPGSTFKPLVAWAALASGIISPTTTYQDGGVYEIANCTGPGCRRTNDNSAAIGTVDIARSLTRSSNVYYYWLGDLFWQARFNRGDLLQENLASLGLGSVTGVPLAGEAAGVVPGPAWKAETWASLPEDQQPFGDPNWYPGDEANMATGQGDVLTTPLQMAMVYGVFANGGTVHQPRLVARILAWSDDVNDPSAGTWLDPVTVRNVAMEPAWQDQLVRGMVGVTASSEGTARSAFVDWDHAGWPVAAKTGTAEVQGRADSSVFAAFGPVDAPEIVAFAVLEESGYGGEAAAPMIRRILDTFVGAPAPVGAR
jgi:penicillin-binding protein 2